MTVLSTRPRLYMEVENHGRFEVAQFSMDFARNMIPKASCVLAVGRKVTDGRTPARIHTERKNIQKMSRVQIFFKGSGQFDSKNDWPKKYVKIFDGKLLGFGQQKIRGKLNVVANLGHWAMDMNFSSAVSSESHPDNPAQYTFSAVLGGLLRSGAADGRPYGIFQTAEADSIHPVTIREDLWGRAIKPMLCAMARRKHVRISGILTPCVGLEAGKNDLALEALKRFEGVSGADDCDKELSCYTEKLSMQVGADVPPAVALAISQAILQESVDSWVNNTLWSKLINFSSQFGFSVIPLVDKAIVVPFTAGLRETYCKSISSDEYDHVDISGDLKRPVRAVAIYATHDLNSGAFDALTSASAVLGLGGCFSPADADLAGMIHFIRPPAWLAGTSSAGYSTSRTLGFLGGRRGTSSSTTPIDIDEDLRGGKDGRTSEDVVREMVEMYNGYAHYAYIKEALRGRVGTVSGKLRFDIAPGSTIRISGSSEKFLSASDSLGQDIIGDVVYVSTVIDAESPRAGTAIQVANCRTESENEDDRTSLEQHPLYTTKYTGAPLVDELQFGDCC